MDYIILPLESKKNVIEKCTGEVQSNEDDDDASDFNLFY